MDRVRIRVRSRVRSRVKSRVRYRGSLVPCTSYQDRPVAKVSLTLTL
jgi:hypothetical protein